MKASGCASLVGSSRFLMAFTSSSIPSLAIAFNYLSKTAAPYQKPLPIFPMHSIQNFYDWFFGFAFGAFEGFEEFLSVYFIGFCVLLRELSWRISVWISFKIKLGNHWSFWELDCMISICCSSYIHLWISTLFSPLSSLVFSAVLRYGNGLLPLVYFIFICIYDCIYIKSNIPAHIWLCIY